jgi:hypothetical protein
MTRKTVRDLVLFITNTYLLLGFSLTPIGTSSRAPGALRRAGTMVRSPMDVRRDKEKAPEGDMTAQEVQALCSLHAAAYPYRGLGLWQSPGTNLSSNIPRRRIHR